MLATVSRQVSALSALCRRGTNPVHQRWFTTIGEQPPKEIVFHRSEGEERAHLMTIRNGEKVKPTFSAAEMNNRISKLRKHMEENNIEGVLFTSTYNINYYSDFNYLNLGRPYGLAVTHDTMTTISAIVDWGHPWRRAHTCGNLVYTDWQRDNFWRAVQKELGHVRGKVGIEFDTMPMSATPKMKQAVPNAADMVDITGPTMQLRVVKSEEEIELIRGCVAAADVGGLAQIEAMQEGATEYEIAMHGTAAMVRHIGKTFPGTELRDSQAWFQTGINTDGGHNPPSSNILNKGVISSINAFPMISGYYAALKRTCFLDHVPDENLRLWEINCKVVRRGLELIKPGAKCKDITNELNEIYHSHDLLDAQVGVICHYYGRERALEFREDTDTSLKPNMIVSMEPMMVIQDHLPGAGGYREHNIVLVSETGYEGLTGQFSGHGVGPDHFVIKRYLTWL